MDTVTAKQVKAQLANFPDDVELCPHCHTEVANNEDLDEYCPNEMCLCTS